jgi:hypothetical protein
VKAGNGFRRSAPVLQVRVTAYSLSLRLTRLSPDSANKAEEGQKEHDDAPSENWLP